VVHQNESDYFQADEAAYNDSDLNAAEATAIEVGWAGEDNVLSRYATEHGQKPLDVAFGDSASQLGVNTRQKAEALYGAITSDPLGLVVDTVNGAYESVVTCVTTSTCIAPDQTHGTARDRQLVAELQGNADAAVAEAADNLGATLGELTAVPGVGKAAKSGVVGLVDTAVDQGRRNARDWAEDVRPTAVNGSGASFVPEGIPNITPSAKNPSGSTTESANLARNQPYPSASSPVIVDYGRYSAKVDQQVTVVQRNDGLP